MAARSGRDTFKAKSPRTTQARSGKAAKVNRLTAPAASARQRVSLSDLAHELERRNEELNEARKQQEATAEILKVINTSRGNLTPVFNIILEKAHSLCDVPCGSLQLFDNDHTRAVAVRGMTEPFEKFLRQGYRLDRSQPVQFVRPFQIDDLAKMMVDAPQGSGLRVAFELGHIRTLLSVPLIRDGVYLGRIVAARQEVRPFSPHQIAVLQSFADQAVIAIENARLFDEVQTKTRDLTEALKYQTGSANILNVIASSPTDVQPVLEAIVESSCELCEAYDAVVILKNGDELQLSAHHGPIPMNRQRWVNDRSSASGRAIADRLPVHIRDILSDEGSDFAMARQMSVADGCRTLLSAPLLREGEAIGAIALRRREVHPFSDKQVALLQTFADQAVIAIGNVRLFDEVQARTKQLAASLQDLRTAQDRLVQTQKLASLGQLTAGIAHEIKNPLNFVNNFAALSSELTDELTEVLKPVALSGKVREEVNELTGTLKDNLGKVVQHGKRADSIVKNMLLHSREGSGEHRQVEINAIIDESLNLAYHGARAEKQGFNITLERDFDPTAGVADIYPQEVTRVLLNLISNGFYAATQRGRVTGNSFEPKLKAVTRNLGDRVEIRIRDNGTGIPPDIREKIFNPFFTTKPAGEGTGLGLSMSHDIVVKQHGGTLDVVTEPGSFTEFIITLPRVMPA